MNNVSKDTDKLFSDMFDLLGRWLVVIWNGLMRLFMVIGLMPVFQKHPKLLAAFIVLMCFITPPITVLWASLGFIALAGKSHMNESFIIDLDKNVLDEEENEAEVFRDGLALRLYEEGVDEPVNAANKVTEAQFGKPIDELISLKKYKSDAM